MQPDRIAQTYTEGLVRVFRSCDLDDSLFEFQPGQVNQKANARTYEQNNPPNFPVSVNTCGSADETPRRDELGKAFPVSFFKDLQRSSGNVRNWSHRVHMNTSFPLVWLCSWRTCGCYGDNHTCFPLSQHVQRSNTGNKNARQKELALEPFAEAYYATVRSGILGAYVAAIAVKSRLVCVGKIGRLGKVGAAGRPSS